MKIIFMGSPEFAVPAFEAVADSAHEIIAVYTKPPKEAGRGQKLRMSPVHMAALERGLPVFTPHSLRDAQEQAHFADSCADIAVVAAYGLILPPPILEGCAHGCINIHPSTLPRWRGAAPIQRTIMAGDARTSVAIMQMDAGLDTGDVLLQRDYDVPPDMTAGQLHDMLAYEGAALLLSTLDDIAAGRARRVAQDEEGATYARKITKEEARIDFSRDVLDVHNLIRGLSPFPGAFMEMNGQRVKILRAEYEMRDHGCEYGKVVDITREGFAITCTGGVIKPLILQRQGKKAMDSASFLRGFEI